MKGENVAMFHGPIKKRHIPARWNLRTADKSDKPNNHDVRGRYRTTRPDPPNPKWYTDYQRGKK